MRQVFRIACRLSPGLAARLALHFFTRPSRRTLDAADAPLLAEARLRRLEFEDRALQLYEWGPPAATARHSVLLLHGWGSHAPRWSSFVRGIVDRGWRALAFDAPAHGRSGGAHATLAQFRSALDAVIGAAGPVDAAIAHSLGALALAMHLADTGAGPPLGAAVLVSLPPDLGYLLDSFLQVINADPPFARRVHDLFVTRFGQPATAFDSTSLAPRIHIPTLLVHDSDDDIVPSSHAQRLMPLLPRGALYLTHGLGHSGPLRDPATVGATLGFLDGVFDPGPDRSPDQKLARRNNSGPLT